MGIGRWDNKRVCRVAVGVLESQPWSLPIPRVLPRSLASSIGEEIRAPPLRRQGLLPRT